MKVCNFYLRHLHTVLPPTLLSCLGCPDLPLCVGGGEYDHVSHEDDDTGAEHRDDDCKDDVELAVLLVMKTFVKISANCVIQNKNIKQNSDNFCKLYSINIDKPSSLIICSMK